MFCKTAGSVRSRALPYLSLHQFLKKGEITVSSANYHLGPRTCVYCLIKREVQCVHARIRTSDVFQ
jgi:hypothetical protein